MGLEFSNVGLTVQKTCVNTLSEAFLLRKYYINHLLISLKMNKYFIHIMKIKVLLFFIAAETKKKSVCPNNAGNYKNSDQ
jgi:hypothetical protein